MNGLPSFSMIVGVMLLSGRFLGSTELEVPGCGLKSSISSFSMMPVPGTRTPEPKKKLIVWVSATMLPCWSMTERWLVPPDPTNGSGLPAGILVPTVSRLMPLRSSAA